MSIALKSKPLYGATSGGLLSKGGLRHNILVVKRGIDKFVSMFTRNYGLRVVFRGMECHTSGRGNTKTITLPELALLERKNMTDVELQESLDFLYSVWGFVIHEGLHVRYTDLQIMANAHEDGGSKKQAIVNALEDVRIEALGSREMVGVREALKHTRLWSQNRIVANTALGSTLDPAKVSMFGHLIYAICSIGQFEDYKKAPVWSYLDPKVTTLAVKHRKMILKAGVAASTAEVLKLAEELWAELEKAQQQQPPPPPPKGQKAPKQPKGAGDEEDQPQGGGAGDDSEESDEDSEEDEGKAASKPKKRSRKSKSAAGEGDDAEESDEDAEEDGEEDSEEEGAGGGKEDGDDEEASGSGGGEEDASEDDDDEDAGGGAAGEDSEEDTDPEDENDGTAEGDGEAEENPADAEEGGAQGSQAGGGQSDELLGGSTSEKDHTEHIEDTLQNFMKGLDVASMNTDEYRVFTTETDIREHLPIGPYAREEWGAIDDSVRTLYGPVKRVLEARLKAATLAYRMGEMEEGELDVGMLHKLPVGISSRIFAQDVVSKSLQGTVVGLICDVSGSMFYNMGTAKKAMAIFGGVLDALKVPFMAWGFTTGSEGRDRYYNASEDEKRLFTRFGAVHIRVIKEVAESWQTARLRIPAMQPENNAYDGECLKLAAQELISRPEKRKVLIVTSDGSPEGNEPGTSGMSGALGKYLKTVASELTEAQQVELVGIGINTDSVRHFYPKHFVVRDIKDLPTLVTSELARILLGK